MRRQVILVSLMVIGSMVCSLAAAQTSSKRKGTATSPAKIVADLEALLAEQEQLLATVQEIQQELAIVKIRASTPKSCPSCP